MIGFLDVLSPGERQELEALCTPRSYDAGAILFKKGDPASCAVLVDAGRVSLETQLPGAETVAVAEVGPGELFGERMIVPNTVRSLTARAAEAVRCRMIERVDFLGLLKSFRPVSFKVLMQVARMTAQRFTGADDAAQAVEGSADRPSEEEAPPLGTTEVPGCSFDPRPFVSTMPLFDELASPDVDALFALGTLWELPRGRELIRSGQRSDRCFIVLRGAVEVSHPVSGLRMGLLGPGRILGHTAPLLGQRALATCRVRERCVVLELGPEAFRTLTTPTSRVAYKFLNAVVVGLLDDLTRTNHVVLRAAKLRLLAEARA